MALALTSALAPESAPRRSRLQSQYSQINLDKLGVEIGPPRYQHLIIPTAIKPTLCYFLPWGGEVPSPPPSDILPNCTVVQQCDQG